jgi:hypothetical protein
MDAAELERRLAEQETLLELGLALAETLDLRRVLTVALEKAEQVCAAETSSIWELDESTGELFFRVVRGRAAPEIENLRIPLGEGIVGSVAAAGRAEVIRDVTSELRWIGGDGAYSVDLGAGRVLWLFGDSFIASTERRVRAESRMVRNALAIQHGYDPTRAFMQFWWPEVDGEPQSFHPEDGDAWF